MGTNYNANLIVGCWYEELDVPEFKDNDWVEKLGLEIFHPYPNAELCECLVGLDIPVDEVDWYWLKNIRWKLDKFKKLTGKEGKLQLTADIC